MLKTLIVRLLLVVLISPMIIGASSCGGGGNDSSSSYDTETDTTTTTTTTACQWTELQSGIYYEATKLLDAFIGKPDECTMDTGIIDNAPLDEYELADMQLYKSEGMAFYLARELTNAQMNAWGLELNSTDNYNGTFYNGSTMYLRLLSSEILSETIDGNRAVYFRFFSGDVIASFVVTSCDTFSDAPVAMDCSYIRELFVYMKETEEWYSILGGDVKSFSMFEWTEFERTYQQSENKNNLGTQVPDQETLTKLFAFLDAVALDLGI